MLLLSVFIYLSVADNCPTLQKLVLGLGTGVWIYDLIAVNRSQITVLNVFMHLSVADNCPASRKHVLGFGTGV